MSPDNVLGYRRPGLLRGSRAVAVELKNDVEQLKRGLDQLATFKDYANAVYLACTPALAASYLDRHAGARNVRQWDPELLTRKLKTMGVGLLIVEGSMVMEMLKPVETAPDDRKNKELLDVLREFED